jgi:hypothetical protein
MTYAICPGTINVTDVVGFIQQKKTTLCCVQHGEEKEHKPVSSLQGGLDSLADLAWLALPSSQADGRDTRARVELDRRDLGGHNDELWVRMVCLGSVAWSIRRWWSPSE